MKIIAKKTTLIFTVLFFAIMLFLTFFAESIHISSLPQVEAARAETRRFSVTAVSADGEVAQYSSEKTAVSEKMLGEGIFVGYTAEKNGTKRSFVRLVFPEVGESRSDDGYREVISGINYGDRIIMSTSKELYDGCEVNVIK